MNLQIPEMLSNFFKENQDEINILNEIVDFHEEAFINKHKPLPERPPRLIGQNGLHFIQLALFRSRVLVHGYFQSIETINPLVSALTVRAHYEITGAVAYFYKKLKSFYNGSISLEQLEETLRRLNLGVRSKGDLTEAPDPVNVMTFIEAADKEYRRMSGAEVPIFEESYNYLSEICHPNSFGMFMGSSINKIAVIRYNKIFETTTQEDFFYSNFIITSTAFKLFYYKVFKLLEENEDFPVILDR